MKVFSFFYEKILTEVSDTKRLTKHRAVTETMARNLLHQVSCAVSMINKEKEKPYRDWLRGGEVKKVDPAPMWGS